MPTEYTVNQIAKSDVLCDEDFVLAADYTSLEVERDEWKRRCEKILIDQQRWVDDACYCDFNKHGDRTLTCEYCEQVNRLQEIAEGRDNG